MFDVEDNTFLLAGPVKMHPRVKRAMARPSIGHRSPEFTELNQELRALLEEVYQTTDPVAVLAGSGTLGMDAAARSLLDGDPAVAVDGGKFGNRFANLADRYGEAHVLDVPWGEAPDLDALEDLVADVEPKAVFLTHNETSTGVENPLDEIATIAQDHGALVVADAITSMGSMPVPVDEWGVDVAVVGSQKCFGAPAGLAFVSASDRAREAMYDDKGFYLNLPKHLDRWEDEAQTPFTPAIPLHLATVEALNVILDEGLQARFERVARQAEALRAGLEAMGLDLFTEAGVRSATVTAVEYPEGVGDADVRGHLKEDHGVLVAGGQRHVSGEIFRVGHMGSASFEELAGFLSALEEVLLEDGAPLKQGAWSSAFREARSQG
jgi:aspartate aminotransferase-like enzyme